MTVMYSIFFFQAEDGIRDYDVTGVQTCALPICAVALGFGGGVGLELFLELGLCLGGEFVARIDGVDHQQADGHGDGGGGNVEADGLRAHARQFFKVGQRRHAGHEGGEHQRHGDELEQVHENVAEGDNPVGGELDPLELRGGNPVDQPENHPEDDLPVEFPVPFHG